MVKLAPGSDWNVALAELSTLESMRPGRAAGEREDAARHEHRLVEARAEFGANVGRRLRRVGQRELVAAARRGLAIGRHEERGRLHASVRRDADERCRVAPAAFEPRGQSLRLERRVQLIGAGDGHGAVGRGVLPGIAQRAGDDRPRR